MTSRLRIPSPARRTSRLLAAGVRGIAWYVDNSADRAVVTVDRTVSTAEVATIKMSVGANAAALRIEHATGVFRPPVWAR